MNPVTTSDKIKVELFNEYCLPSQKNLDKLYNIYSKKFDSVKTLITKSIPHKYIETTSNKPIKLNIMQNIQQILGIKNSCQPFEINELNFYNTKQKELFQLVPIIDQIFNFQSTANNPHLQMSNRFIKLFDNWANIKCKRTKFQKRINEKIQSYYILQSLGNEILYNTLVSIS